MKTEKTQLKIEQLTGIGQKRLSLLKKMGIDSIDALLEFYPRLYEDWSSCFSVSEAPIGEQCCIKAIVVSNVYERNIRKGLTIYKFTATDSVTNLSVTLFNNKYAAQKIKQGGEYLFFGKVSGSLLRKEMTSPQIEPVESANIRPIYKQTQGLSSKVIQNAVQQALKLKGDDLFDPLPDEVRTEYGLCHKRYAVSNIHFPETQDDIEIAKKRLIFEELLILQLGLLRLKGRNRKLTALKIIHDYSDELITRLPFELTNAQKSAVNEAVVDMTKDKPMNRLLQGDVGSGKTAVAAVLMFNAARNGFQSALMAPTEVLASQHYHSISKLLNQSGIKVMLLTGSTPTAERRTVLSQLKDGEISIIIGTHALIQETVEFNKLGLVITDEQHRFGVDQRSTLSKKGNNPHVYVMSATPIPRTLALIIYGDLDISILDEMPKGRQKIDTYVVSSKLRNRAYGYIKQHLDKGLQGYVVCPMIEEGELEIAAAVEFYERLKSNEFKNYSVGLLNGRMKADEKENTMSLFSRGEIQLLVSTTVIEVGVDVKNAVIMIIENAERFGLSQLHQLRGRVGRGEHKSTCILISDAENDEAKRRLKIISETTDGFKIADEDLKLRGPGDFFGSRQHGLPKLKIANILSDMNVLKVTGKLAKKIIRQDPLLASDECFGLKVLTNRLFKQSENSDFN